MGAGDPDSGLHSCTANTSNAEPSPASSHNFLIQLFFYSAPPTPSSLSHYSNEPLAGSRINGVPWKQEGINEDFLLAYAKKSKENVSYLTLH